MKQVGGFLVGIVTRDGESLAQALKDAGLGK